MSTAIAQQLALVFMGRALDSQWASSTANLLNGSQPSVALQTAFYNAAVAEGVFSTSDSPSALVNDIFQNIFGFGASTFEQTAWGNLITNGTITKETAAWTIFKSYLGATNVPDAYKLPAQSKLVAMNAYSTELAADAAGNLALASGGAAATLARTYVSGVTSQATAATAIAGVAASVDALTVVPGTTYTLTAGADSLTGTANNDTFIAAEAAAAAATLTVGDSINGGAGTDTLNITQTAVFLGVPVGVTVSSVENVNVTSGAAVTINTASGFSGLTALKTTGVGAANVTAAATTSVNVITSEHAATAVAVNGGQNVSVVATGTTTGEIAVGGTTAPVGTVTVAKTISGAGNVTGGAIDLKGGTVVSSTTTATNSDLTGTTVTQGTVNVVGTATTTAATVKQSATVASVAAAAAVTAVAGVTDTQSLKP